MYAYGGDAGSLDGCLAMDDGLLAMLAVTGDHRLDGRLLDELSVGGGRVVGPRQRLGSTHQLADGDRLLGRLVAVLQGDLTSNKYHSKSPDLLLAVFYALSLSVSLKF